MYLRLLTAGLALFSFSALATPFAEGIVNLHFVQKSEPSAAKEATTVKVAGWQTGEASTSARALAECGADPPCRIPLPSGAWNLSFEAPGWFMQDSQILVQQGTQDLSIEMKRTGLLRGALKTPEASLPALTARFSSSVDSGAEVLCTVEPDAYECAIPAGTWDVRIGAAGFMSQYHWDVTVIPEKKHTLGVFALQRGSSFVGFVDLASGLSGTEIGRMEDAVVILTEVGASGKSSVSTRPNARGFFHFPTISPGSYQVIARLGKLESDLREVKLLNDREASLREALILDRLKQLRVRINPPSDPAGMPWNLEVAELSRDGRRVSSPVTEKTSEDGEAILSRLRTGVYRVSLSTSNGSTWATQRVEIGPADESLILDGSSLRVRGQVSYLDRPLGASLRFRNRRNGAEVGMTSNHEGEFRGFVPTSPESWEVRVESNHPSIVRDLMVELRSFDGEAALNLTLPSSGVDGRVLDEAGRIVTERGIVTLSQENGASMVQASLLEDGTFAFHGLEAGSHQLRVSTYDQRESDTILIRIEEDEIAEVEVLVKESEGLRGIVTHRGRPVPGATVWSFPGGSQQLFYIPLTTDENGRFNVSVPRGSSDVDFFVQARGFATRLFRHAGAGSRVTVELEQHGGTLEIVLPPLGQEPNALHPFLMHGRAWVPARMLTRGASENEYGVSSQVYVEPGVYALCLAVNLWSAQAGVPSHDCVTGTVPYGGSARLDVRPMVQEEESGQSFRTSVR